MTRPRQGWVLVRCGCHRPRPRWAHRPCQTRSDETCQARFHRAQTRCCRPARTFVHSAPPRTARHLTETILRARRLPWATRGRCVERDTTKCIPPGWPKTHRPSKACHGGLSWVTERIHTCNVPWDESSESIH